MRFFTLLICLVILLCSCSEKSTVERKKWEGAEVRGAVLADEDCPVLLERETVTFDLPEFPYLGTDSAEKFLAYPGRVTTEYHFYNPTDEAVTVKLAFPVYGRAAYSAIEEGDPVSDLHKYSITLGGKTVTPELRHSMRIERGLSSTWSIPPLWMILRHIISIIPRHPLRSRPIPSAALTLRLIPMLLRCWISRSRRSALVRCSSPVSISI